MIYLLGFLPSLFFSLRFLIQWIRSEKAKRSYVDATFWKLSCVGNALLSLHYFIQQQYPFFLLQVINGFIAWRNLDLIKVKKESFKVAFCYLIALLTLVSFLFFARGIPIKFFEVPQSLITAHQTQEVSLLWHLMGVAGGFLFGIRFWIQWWHAEKNGKSELSQSFWTLSISGCLLALVYFFRIRDWVSILNYAAPLIPFIRNTILLRKNGA